MTHPPIFFLLFSCPFYALRFFFSYISYSCPQLYHAYSLLSVRYDMQPSIAVPGKQRDLTMNFPIPLAADVA